MEIATTREVVNLTNNTKAVTPFGLRQVLAQFPNREELEEMLKDLDIDPGQIDLKDYAKLTDLPTKNSQLENDSNYVSTVDGLIPSSVLPSYVDDVLTYDDRSKFPNPGVDGKIYIAKDTNITYRWSGSDYIEISKSLSLGTTSSTAYRGDHGLIAYNHANEQGNPHNLTLDLLGITIAAEVINNLQGLEENILVALGKKLNLTGGTLTGHLTLHSDPVEKMHAATKKYVDEEIDGISITVTQNITRIENLTKDTTQLKSNLELQAETIVDVQGTLDEVDQKTINNTTLISNLSQDVQGLESTVSKTQDTVTILETTINQLEVIPKQDTIFVKVDSENKPLKTESYTIEYVTKYRGNITDPETFSLTNIHTGITSSFTKNTLTFNVDNSIAIPDDLNEYVLTVGYTQTLDYEASVLIAIITVKEGKDGEQGPQGIQGEQGPAGADGANGQDGAPGEDGKDAAISSTTEPTDTTQLWLDLNTGELKHYVVDESGNGSWEVLNDYNNVTDDIIKELDGLKEELKNKVDELNALKETVSKMSETVLEQTSSAFEMKFKQIETDISEVLGEIQTHVSEQKQYIRFEQGIITLGEEDNPYTLKIDNDNISIYYGGGLISTWNKKIFIATEVSIKDESWNYKFSWLPRTNGSLSLRKVSDI